MRKERRHYPRFKFESNVVVIGFGVIGKVADASLDGIGVKYNKREQPLLTPINDLEIFKIDTKGNLLQMKIAAKIISDIYLSNTNIIYFHSRCGFQFMRFSEDQLRQLENFLNRPLSTSSND